MAAFDWPDAPTLNQQVTGPGGQTYEWDGEKWIAIGAGGTWAPITNPPAGANNYLAMDSIIDGGTYN